MRAVAHRRVDDPDRVAHAGTSRVAWSSATRTAALVMMSRLPGVLGQVVAGALDLEQDREHVVVDVRRRGQPVSGHVARDRLDHARRPRRATAVVIGAGHVGVDRVAHQHRRVGRVEQHDRLAPRRAADLLQRASGRLGELVDVGPRARPGGAGRDRRDDLGVGDVGDRRDRGDDGHGGLRAAGDEVDVGRVAMGVEVDRRDHRRPERGRRQVDREDPALGEQLGVLGVGGGGGRVEGEVDLADACRAGPRAPRARSRPRPRRRARGPGESGSMPGHPDQLQRRAAADLRHQVAADVARADDHHPERLSHVRSSFGAAPAGARSRTAPAARACARSS